MKIYIFNENDEIQEKSYPDEIPEIKKTIIKKKKEKKFNDPGRKKKYKVINWEHIWYLMKWNGEKYVVIEESKKEQLLLNKVKELYKTDCHEARLRYQIKKIEESHEAEKVSMS